MPDLTGSRVLITGASSGIGAETARRLAQSGADVALVARGAKGLAKAAEAVRAHGRKAVVIEADVTDRAAAERAVEAAARQLGGLDSIVVNAGAAAYGKFSDVEADDFDAAVRVTLLGAVYVIRAALPHLERTAGTIVVTGSVVANLPMPLMTAYAGAKHGLRGFVNSLRVELKATRSPVRIGMVHPGPVDTPFWKHVTPADRMPPDLPVAYRPETVAKALVAAVADPRPEHTVGWAMRGAQLLRTVGRPVFDATLVAAARYALARPSDQDPGDTLDSPTGEGRLDGGIQDRPRSVDAKARATA